MAAEEPPIITWSPLSCSRLNRPWGPGRRLPWFARLLRLWGRWRLPAVGAPHSCCRRPDSPAHPSLAPGSPPARWSRSIGFMKFPAPRSRLVLQTIRPRARSVDSPPRPQAPRHMHGDPRRGANRSAPSRPKACTMLRSRHRPSRRPEPAVLGALDGDSGTGQRSQCHEVVAGTFRQHHLVS